MVVSCCCTCMFMGIWALRLFDPSCGWIMPQNFHQENNLDTLPHSVFTLPFFILAICLLPRDQTVRNWTPYYAALHPIVSCIEGLLRNVNHKILVFSSNSNNVKWGYYYSLVWLIYAMNQVQGKLNPPTTQVSKCIGPCYVILQTHDSSKLDFPDFYRCNVKGSRTLAL